MNQDIIQGKWKEIKGRVKEKWGKLTDNDIDRINGQSEQLAGSLQKIYGYTREKAEKEVEDFRRTLH